MTIDIETADVMVTVCATGEPQLEGTTGSRPAVSQPALQSPRKLWCATNDDPYWPSQRAVLASVEELSYAHELRLQLRERYEQQRKTPRPWCIDVD